MDPQVPLVMPEVNAAAIDGYIKRKIVSVPDGVTAQLVRALKPLHDAAGGSSLSARQRCGSGCGQ